MEKVISQFAIYGDLVSWKAFGSGHINNTYVSTFSQGNTLVRYTHQRINKTIFKQPNKVVENISLATNHIAQSLQAEGKERVSSRTLTLVPTKKGELFFVDPEGEYWRTYLFIEKVKTYEFLESNELAYEVGKSIGIFQKQLSDYAGQRLYDTIPSFHDMHLRYKAFNEALSQDIKKRAHLAKSEIDFLQENKKRGMILTDGLAQGILKESITHNDTKLNNILFDEKTGEALCIIDLDTVMPGTILFDTGDLIRTATNTAEEDERDLSKVTFNKPIFDAIKVGYFSVAKDFISDYEASLFAESGRTITQIMAVRFITDYLSGDVYYKTERENHNLDRARTQIKLMQSMDEQLQY